MKQFDRDMISLALVQDFLKPLMNLEDIIKDFDRESFYKASESLQCMKPVEINAALHKYANGLYKRVSKKFKK